MDGCYIATRCCSLPHLTDSPQTIVADRARVKDNCRPPDQPDEHHVFELVSHFAATSMTSSSVSSSSSSSQPSAGGQKKKDVDTSRPLKESVVGSGSWARRMGYLLLTLPLTACGSMLITMLIFVVMFLGVTTTLLTLFPATATTSSETHPQLLNTSVAVTVSAIVSSIVCFLVVSPLLSRLFNHFVSKATKVE